MVPELVIVELVIVKPAAPPGAGAGITATAANACTATAAAVAEVVEGARSALDDASVRQRADRSAARSAVVGTVRRKKATATTTDTGAAAAIARRVTAHTVAAVAGANRAKAAGATAEAAATAAATAAKGICGAIAAIHLCEAWRRRQDHQERSGESQGKPGHKKGLECRFLPEAPFWPKRFEQDGRTTSAIISDQIGPGFSV